jgi:hypothetical protein
MATEIPTSFTFEGSTIQLSQAQKDTLQRDLDVIDNYQATVNSELTSYNYQSSQYNSYLNRDCGSNSLPRRAEYNRCMSERNGGMNYHAPLRDAAKAKYDAALVNLQAATKNYNDDLAAIQNDIKLQVQAAQAQAASNAAAAAANATQAQSQATIATSTPQTAINAQNAAAQVQIKKEEEKRKIITYTIFGVVVLVIVIVVIKKLF